MKINNVNLKGQLQGHTAMLAARQERGEGDKDFQQTAATVASDTHRASSVRWTRGALWCDLATVLLSSDIKLSPSKIQQFQIN